MSIFTSVIAVILLTLFSRGLDCQTVSPPNGVRFHSKTSKTVIIQWNATVQHIVYEYQVFYRKKGDGNSWSTKTVGNTTTEVKLEGLQPFTYYIAQVMVNTSSGVSNKSDAEEVRTEEDLPNAPSGLKAKFTSLSNLNISWSLLSFDQANGIIHGYRYIVFNSQNKVISNRTVSNTTNSININSSACASYTLKVRAWTGAGNGNYSTFKLSNSCKPPKITSFKEQVLAKLHSFYLVLPCNFTGFPKPSVAWILNDGIKINAGYGVQHKVFLPGGTQILTKTILLYHNGSLVISFVEARDKGNYTCVVNQTTAGFGAVTRTTTLFISGGTFSKTFQVRLLNEDFHEDLENKKSKRYKDLSSKFIPAVRRLYNDSKNYIIQDVSIVHYRSGSVIVMFSISASIESAKEEKSVEANIVDILFTNIQDGKLGNFSVGNLTVYGPPPPPIALEVERLGSTYVFLKWKPPKHDDLYDVDSYSMQYRKHGQKEFKSVKTIENIGQEISGKLDGLEGGVKYVVRIMSHRKTGDTGQDSQGVTKEISTHASGLLKTILLVIVLPVALALLIVFIIGCVLRKRCQEKQVEEHRLADFSAREREENPYDIGRLLEEFPCKWKELSRDDLEIGKELGSGAFGVVNKAVIKIDDNSIPCAVKMLKDFATERERRDLFNELSIMAQVGYHPHVISLLGACTRGGPLWVVVKLAENGSLLDYLHEHRKPDYMDHSYQNVPGSSKANDEIEEINKLQKLKFAHGIAKGMSHLEKLKCVHRDLAARNVLLGKHMVAMVSDFGLSRDIYESGMYEDVRGGKRPVRWMAPESIEDYTCTTKSDVWSFGVTLWEVETAGTIPYAGVDSGMDILNEIKKGYRLEQPKDCDDDVYHVMKSTWHTNPLERPTFLELSATLEEMLIGISEYLELEPEDEYQEVFISAYDEVNINTLDLEDSDIPAVVALPNNNVANGLNECPPPYDTVNLDVPETSNESHL